MNINILRNTSSGFTVIQLLLSVLVLGIIVSGFFYLLNNERSKTRDAERLADMARVQAAFQMLYATNASYISAAENGCGTVGSLVNSCNLTAQMPDIGTIKDPGQYAYTVNAIPSDQGYEVVFRLENSYGSLKSGFHSITEDGLR